MATKSAIEWTETTWNPVTGCDRVAAGCDNCYALALSKRLKAMGVAKYQNDGDPRTSGPGFGVTTHPKSLAEPYGWSGSRLVFVNSMSDLFHAKVPIDFVRDVFEVIRETPQHTYQALTKRAQRLARISVRLEWPENLWMGVSVESSEATARIDQLRNVPAPADSSHVSHCSVPSQTWISTAFTGSSSAVNRGRVLDRWILSGLQISGTSASRPMWPSSLSSGAAAPRRPTVASSRAECGTKCRGLQGNSHFDPSGAL